MVNRDYTKELGMDLAQKTVPMPFVLALVALILAVGGYGFHATWPAPHHAPTKAAAAAPASVAVAGK
jgi:hypothetical protein